MTYHPMKANLGKTTLHKATAIIQELVTDPNSEMMYTPEEVENILSLARAGSPGYNEKACELIRDLMQKYGLIVEGMELNTAAEKIYQYLWGLDIIEELYRSSTVNELRINSNQKVYYQENGKNKKSEIQFKDYEHVTKIIGRILEHDGVSLDESNPGIESRRLNGTRITALGPPVTSGPLLVLRKHGTFEISRDNYINSGTMDSYTASLLELLARGRANILICGGANTGKTTLLRWLFSFQHPMLRTVTIETDRELLLDEWYPDRDVVSLEAHPELAWDIKRCFAITLRLSPDVVIVGEARGLGEARGMIDACRSGHHGTMGTIHVLSVHEALSVLAQMAMEEGRNLPLEILENQVAEAFDVIIQMYGNSITGVKKVERITEVRRGNAGPEFHDLVVWEPSAGDYEQGRWSYPGEISDELSRKLFKYGVSRQMLLEMEWERQNVN